MRRRTIAPLVLTAFVLASLRLASAQASNLERVRVLMDSFLESYDRLPVDGGAEFLIKTFGRGSYRQLLEKWHLGISTGRTPSTELDASYDGLVRAIRSEAPDLEEPFRKAARELTVLSYRNFDLYLDAAASGGAFTPGGTLDSRRLDEILATESYAARFDEIVRRERAAKAAIWAVLDEPRLRSSVPFYRFVFERVNRMRERILARHEAARRERRLLALAD